MAKLDGQVSQIDITVLTCPLTLMWLTLQVCFSIKIKSSEESEEDMDSFVAYQFLGMHLI